MPAVLLLLLLLAVGVPLGGASAPLPQHPSPPPAPRQVARLALETLNQQDAGSPFAFRLLKIRSVQKTTFPRSVLKMDAGCNPKDTFLGRFVWGVHFSMNFTIKETTCRKSSSYRIGNCKYKPNGLIRDCSAEVSVLSLVDDAPLTSVQCSPGQRGSGPGSKNAKPDSRPQTAAMAPPNIHVEHYFPSSYSTAALTAIEEE